MKSIVRIVAASAAALSLVASSAAFAAERDEERARGTCSCMGRPGTEKAAHPSAPEAPIFTDQG